jgi:hypothetical protein
MKFQALLLVSAAALCATLVASAANEPVVTDNRVITEERRMAMLEVKLASLNRQIALLEDTRAIERLQQAYGYYISEGLGGPASDLFSDSPTASIELAQQGVYIGRNRIREFLTHGGEGLKPGELRESPITQGVVHVAPDGKTAKARWRMLVMAGTHGQDGTWAEGPYENEYVKEDGVWKLQKVRWYTRVKGSYDEGWHKKPLPADGPLADLPPDRPPSEKYEPFPAFSLAPYHYLHPITKKPVAWDAP